MSEDKPNEKLKAEVVKLISSEEALRLGGLRDQLDPAIKGEDDPGCRFFSRLLEVFVHLEFNEEEAIEHWARIMDHYRELSGRLGRKIGLPAVLADYFTNDERLLDSPMLIEIHVFKQTERLAMIDGLTGAFNRRYMDIALKKELNRCARYSKDLSIFIIDIDDFKIVNDTYGHVFGDTVLIELARLMRETMREEDVVCRYGGEEFLAILPETQSGGAMILAERLRAAAAALPLLKDRGITFSGGIATFPGMSEDPRALVMTADRALYRAKFSGKNRVLIAEAKDKRDVATRDEACAPDREAVGAQEMAVEQ
jgi:diguanylate cyclase (GGDEF)-like protein